MEEEEGARAASLQSIMNELKDFRRDNKQHLAEIKQELRRTNNRLDEAEGRIDEVENTLMAVSSLLKKLVKRNASLERKLTDQEGRARRDNIRIYGIPEGDEGDNMTDFVQNLFKVSLDLPPDMNIAIERAHRALTAKSADPEAKPRSIVAKFASHAVKEEVIRTAWQKKSLPQRKPLLRGPRLPHCCTEETHGICRSKKGFESEKHQIPYTLSSKATSVLRCTGYMRVPDGERSNSGYVQKRIPGPHHTCSARPRQRGAPAPVLMDGGAEQRRRSLSRTGRRLKMQDHVVYFTRKTDHGGH